MKKIGLILGVATLLAAMSSCSKTEWCLDSNGSRSDKVASTNLQVTSVDKEGYTLTRVVNEKTAFENGDAIGVWVADATTNNGTYNDQTYSNIKLSYDKPEEADGTWNLASSIPLTETKAKLYALYPYNEKMTGTEVALSWNDETDYLYDVQEGLSGSNPNVGLSMKHLRSLLVVNIKRGTYTGDEEFDHCHIRGPGLYLDGSYDLMTNTFSGTYWGIVHADKSYTSTDKNDVLTYQWFVFTPSSAEEGKLKFEVWEDWDSQIITVTSKDNVSFEPGKKYIFTLTINEDKHVEVSDAQVEPWVDGANEDITVKD